MRKASLNIAKLAILLFLLQGCIRLHFPERPNLINLKNEVASLNGYYDNLATDTSKTSFWNAISKVERKKIFTNYNSQNAYVQIIANDNNSIVVKLFVDSTLKEEKLFKGKVKGRYFSVKRKIKYFGLPLIYMMQSDWKLQFAKDQNGTIHIDEAYSSMGWIFIMVGGRRYKNNYFFVSKL